MSGNSVAFIYEDHEGNLWVATDGGLDLFRDTPVVSFSIVEGYPRQISTRLLPCVTVRFGSEMRVRRYSQRG